MAQRFFFFPHSLENDSPSETIPKKATPSRVVYSVIGPLVAPNGTTPNGSGIVMADGYVTKQNKCIVGGNQDPCIFSSPLGCFHSFCRIVNRKGNDHDVIELSGPSNRPLPHLVAAGDVIFYGKPQPNVSIAVDTVLVVDKVVPIQTLVAQATHSDDAWVYNLSDTGLAGTHPGDLNHKVIVGKTQPSWNAVQALETSFVPLAERISGRWQVLRILRSMLPNNFDPVMRHFEANMFPAGKPNIVRNKGLICEIPPTDGVALAQAVVAQSRNTMGQGVFVPPLSPSGAVVRLGSDEQIRSNVDHIAWLARFDALRRP